MEIKINIDDETRKKPHVSDKTTVSSEPTSNAVEVLPIILANITQATVIPLLEVLTISNYNVKHLTKKCNNYDAY